jgi:hypothetical protein
MSPEDNNAPKKILPCFMTCNQNLSKSSSLLFWQNFAKFQKYDFHPIQRISSDWLNHRVMNDHHFSYITIFKKETLVLGSTYLTNLKRKTLAYG